jgi:Flp pilus assembly protein TadB
LKDESNIVDADIVGDENATTQQKASAEPKTSTKNNTTEPTSDLKAKLLSTDHWLRFVFMVLFAVVACVASYVIAVLIVIQFIFALVTGNSEARLQSFGQSLSQYIFQILSFLTYNSEAKPFPFADWPVAEQTNID